MGGESWSLTAKVCDSCTSATATLFCRADSAFLCVGCDTKIHAANKLASRHARVWLCEVCEQAPASVTCKADAAALCTTCDRDIHSANPLASRHERLPVIPFYDAAVKPSAIQDGGDERYFSYGGEAEEDEAASWLLPNPNPKVVDSPDLKSTDSLFSDVDPYLDIDLMEGDRKPNQNHLQYGSVADGVVPVRSKNNLQQQRLQPPSLVDGVPCYDVDYAGSKPFLYNFNSQSLSQSLSSSSLDVGVVPDHNAMAEVSTTTFGQRNAAADSVPVTGIDREARVLRYREKRKNRKFEKTIRYASRKAYAETRPRIKGRFAKRTEVAHVDAFISDAAGYGVVPSF
ncbi:Zinc finger protein like [Actinidia chinensis var. chinensis]|uniref:Zinc finger protein like n=1 Tax=Actinidia chinensis var. chinensis TaxID=1590841 RepID=A0A2R6R4R2_ACTCC|nr:Zinc finger protein like [Actinidia chinensis var. chinensis]